MTVDNFGVTPNHDRGDIETLGGVTETSSGPFGFLGQLFQAASKGAEVYKDITNERELSQHTEVNSVDKPTTTEPATTNGFTLPQWAIPAGLLVLIAVILFFAFKK